MEAIKMKAPKKKKDKTVCQERSSKKLVCCKNEPHPNLVAVIDHAHHMSICHAHSMSKDSKLSAGHKNNKLLDYRLIDKDWRNSKLPTLDIQVSITIIIIIIVIINIVC